jgi:hypothetical protein
LIHIHNSEYLLNWYQNVSNSGLVNENYDVGTLQPEDVKRLKWW